MSAEQQRFLVGFAPATDGTVPSYWKHCKACSDAGFHYIETNNTRLQLSRAYAGRASEFRDEMARLSLRLLGMNQNHAFLDAGQVAEIREKNTAVAKFLKQAGAIYLGWEGLIVPADDFGVPQEENEADLRRVARLANEEGKRIWEQYGLKFTYHPQSTAGLGRLMDLTEPPCLHLNPDLGWLAARGGAKALDVCRAYLSRIMAIHLKDHDPSLEYEWQGKRFKGGTVLPGRGIIDFPGLVKFLMAAGFDGCVMGEFIGLGTFDAARSEEGLAAVPIFKEYMAGRLGLKL